MYFKGTVTRKDISIILSQFVSDNWYTTPEQTFAVCMCCARRGTHTDTHGEGEDSCSMDCDDTQCGLNFEKPAQLTWEGITNQMKEFGIEYKDK